MESLSSLGFVISKNPNSLQDAVSSQGGENLYASRSVSSYFMNIHELSGLRALRGDATQQLRVPIAAAACHCDEDWH